VHGDTLFFVEDLETLGRSAQVDPLVHQRVWHGVEVAALLDVVVEIKQPFFCKSVEAASFYSLSMTR
jgi:hypothetical protein